ncbi:bifunctional glycosyltransferase family 2/GtrA family protein [Mycolicibacterium canariasense]|nr:bifunctional glycosyltransferase family 2/GtrA family protein [Mycolicibacterium canariasense]MCV7212196.1 bifunctional glycosyltransferase family 2/GtrA family protein [Mycolicibacterium canariasense]ORU95353.1 sugar translocase [Mycolicibacterium canariasense]
MTKMAIDSVTLDSGVSGPLRSGALADAARRGVPVLDVVVPVYNEQAALSGSVHRLHRYLAENLPYPVRITIADNASIDDTPRIAADLAEELDGVRVIRLEQKGRGRALNAVWSTSDAPVLAYMDVDLSTDLAALGPLVAPLISGHSDLAIGTRLTRTSRVVRGPKREVISRCYNLILKTTLSARFSDAQCGFKAIRADVAHRLLPLVADTGWFFDTELLVLAERAGLRIHEVPVDWVDDPDSRVDIVATATADLKGIARMRKGFALGRIPVDEVTADLRVGREHVAPMRGTICQLATFGAIGVISTLAYLLIFSALHTAVGPQTANFVALLVTAVVNTAANRRFTFGIRGQQGRARHHGEGLLVFGMALLITGGSLASIHALVHPTPHWLELGVLIAANLVATVLRFIVLRSWVFHPNR